MEEVKDALQELSRQEDNLDINFGRLEICQKFYTTRFLGQKLYTTTMRKLRLFFANDKRA